MREIPCRLVTPEASLPGFTDCAPEATIARETECISSPGFSCPRAERSGEVDRLGDLRNEVKSLLMPPLKSPFEERLGVGVFLSAMSMRARDKSRPTCRVT